MAGRHSHMTLGGWKPVRRGLPIGSVAAGSPTLMIVAAIALSLIPAVATAAFTPPQRITVVTDATSPPYLFRSDDGELKGIGRDKWELWSQKTGIPVVVKGMTWIDAQRSIQQDNDDVIETLSYTPDRASLYEYS